MPKKIYAALTNMLLFYFILGLVSGMSVNGDSLALDVLIGLVFGAIMAYTPEVLAFFKISVNAWSSLLISIVLSFIFFFVASSLLGVIAFGATDTNLGFADVVLQLPDALSTLIFVSLISALGSVSLKQLSKV
ncbi:hypothetical protein KC640_03525 [Candidatus Dojkabacteria bacterium]|uniref:Uncharacterized protein n=1 Tax=Candidatus Dojkabacteria bacterium TaxID=2099670 RepID=A0A955KZU5_9BACT|nr:hypothetical protein [Candidatus Dojkabacteria bacterium]